MESVEQQQHQQNKDAEANLENSSDNDIIQFTGTSGDPTNFDELQRQNDARMDEIEADSKRQPLTSSKNLLQDYCRLEFPYSSSATNNVGVNSDTASGTTTIPATNNNYQQGIASLCANNYTHYRSVRGDGNCFYRAFLYSLIEALFYCSNTNMKTQLFDWFRNDSKENVLMIGQYDEMTIEIFYDCVIDLLERIVKPSTAPTTVTSILSDCWETSYHNELNDENSTSDYCTWYLRVLTATYIKSDPERFLPFILGLDTSDSYYYSTNGDPNDIIHEFCIREIEPMNKECEQIQVLALTESIPNVRVVIEYLDGRHSVNNTASSSSDGGSTNNTPTTGVSQHVFGPNNNKNGSEVIQLTFLYRPGHYDILYRK